MLTANDSVNVKGRLIPELELEARNLNYNFDRIGERHGPEGWRSGAGF
jgi:hypothetical protein